MNADGEKVATRTFVSQYHNLDSEEHYKNIVVGDEGNTRQAQLFENYGSEGHMLTYFQGNNNIPSFVDQLLLSQLLTLPELRDYKNNANWKFTFNTYSAKNEQLSGFSFHKDVPSNGDISLIYSLGTESQFQIRLPEGETQTDSDCASEITENVRSNDLIIMANDARWKYEHRVVPVSVGAEQKPLHSEHPIYRISMVLGCQKM
mmetsp:Transcript_11564/g.14352  ORF Transcript_11564/g.14352 Transcript_11564/m.14352 type:complete len:204 (+) Transcript_11564:173-784(+)